jgi:hypothetical protein
LGGELIGVSCNDILGAEKAAKDETTPLEGEAGVPDLAADDGGGVEDEVDALAPAVVDEDEEVDEVDLSRDGTVGAER